MLSYSISDIAASDRLLSSNEPIPACHLTPSLCLCLPSFSLDSSCTDLCTLQLRFPDLSATSSPMLKPFRGISLALLPPPCVRNLPTLGPSANLREFSTSQNSILSLPLPLSFPSSSPTNISHRFFSLLDKLIIASRTLCFGHRKFERVQRANERVSGGG